MIVKNRLPISRLIGKIDNDFNISESDWIPRVAAWVIDALSQMQILPMEHKRRTLEVSNRIAQFPCIINAKELKVFDSNGCEIPKLNKQNNCSCNKKYNNETMITIDTDNKTGINFMKTVDVINVNSNRNFVLDCNNIELNFDTDTIDVESYEVATYFDDYYQCEVPYIYDNGLLLEALSWYILFKYLSRGSHHPVYNLKDKDVLNPYVQWNLIKPKAMASVKLSLYKDTNGWNNFFYNSTFLPRL